MPRSLASSYNLTDQQRKLRFVILGVVIVLGLLAWLLYVKVYQSPNNVFWDMIDNSLSTNSVIEQLTKKESNDTVSQTIQLLFGAQNLAHSEATVSNANTSVTTEEISTPNQDFVRYLSIDTTKKSASDKPLNFSTLLNLWGESDVSKTSSASIYQLFYQSIFGVVPIANLNLTQRQSLVDYMKSSGMYKPDFSSSKQETFKGRRYITFSVAINLSDYINMLKRLGVFVGAPQLQQFNPSSYSSSASVDYSISIDRLSHQLAEVVSPGNSQSVSYIGYGLSRNVQLPSKTIPLNTLQNGVQSVD